MKLNYPAVQLLATGMEVTNSLTRKLTAPCSLLLVLVALLMGTAQAMAEATAQDWMRRMVEARKQHNYEGVFVYGRGEDVNSVEIVHRYQDGEEQERLVHLDGERREILREGEKVFCVLPGNETVELEQSLPSGPFPGPYAASPMPVSDLYNMTLTGGGRVAGYEAVKLAVMARDEYRYSYLLWLDKETALLLKSLVLNKQGDVLERMQYTSLQIGLAIPDQKLKLAADATLVQQAKFDHSKDAAPVKHIWKPSWLPEGFKEAPYLIKRVAADSGRMHSLVYSDGLSAFSIFVEHAGKQEVPEGASQMGATIAYARTATVADEKYVITVVGEVPLVTAKQVAESMKPQAE